MFKIGYKIVSASFDNIEALTESQLRYNFLLGNVTLTSTDTVIDMSWEWIPLLDFSLGLVEVVQTLSKEDASSACLDITKSAEQIEFIKRTDTVKIIPSFSDGNIEVNFDEFEREVDNLHRRIASYITERVGHPVENEALNKYLKRSHI